MSANATPAEKKQVLQDEFNIPMTQTMDREVSLMCNLSQGVEARGIEKGVLASVQNLVKNTGWTIEKALSVLEVPKEEWKQYSEKLLKQ